MTGLLYLNDVAAGGGSGFINMRFEVQAVARRLLVFHNCYVGTRSLHPDSNHAGLPVAAGDKWACNLWYREESMPSAYTARDNMVGETEGS